MPLPKQKNISFGQYKALKDDIIEVSEQKFENRLNLLEKSITESLRSEIKENTKALKSEMRWLIGLLFTVLATMMTLFKFVK